VFGTAQLDPALLVEIEPQRQAAARGGHRLRRADPAAELDPALAGTPVDIAHLTPIEYPELCGIRPERR
jgi:hypothetical protein